MSELDLGSVDFEEVVRRLTARAVHLCSVLAGLTAPSVLPGVGVGPDDLAMQTVLRLLDPEDGTVIWKKRHGKATTNGVVAYLSVVLRNDLLDLLRTKAHETTVIFDGQPAPSGRDDGDPRVMSLDMFAAAWDGQDNSAIRSEQHAHLLRRFESEPELRDVLAAQLDPEGYQARTNQQLAELLGTTVSEIENRKKRINTRLLRILDETRDRSTEGRTHG